MGNKWVVSVWLQDNKGDYAYHESYRGESLFFALIDMWRCIHQNPLYGHGNVKLDWRN